MKPARIAKRKRRGTTGFVTPSKGSRRGGAIKRQAIRTGGWVNPAGMHELKFLDSSPSIDPPLSAAWTAGTILNASVPGSTASDRIGRKIVMRNLFIRWSFNMAATSTGGSPFRILIVYDKQCNAAAPAITDILLTDDVKSTMNLSNRDRFIVIWDKLTPAIGTTVAQAIHGKKFINLGGLETMYNTGSAGTVGDITSGSMFLFTAQVGTIGTASPAFDSRCRIKYTDV